MVKNKKQNKKKNNFSTWFDKDNLHDQAVEIAEKRGVKIFFVYEKLLSMFIKDPDIIYKK